MNLLHNEEELKATLKRASEIAATETAPASEEQQTLETYLQAAEESGIPRSAFLAAMKERMSGPAVNLVSGSKVFAPSPDGFWYAAEVVSIESGMVDVRFLSGGGHTCAEVSLRPFSLVPGVKVEAKHKTWGWTEGTVHTLDDSERTVKVDDGFGTSKYKLTDIRLPKVKTQREKKLSEVYWRAAVTFGSIGTVVGWFLHTLIRQ